MHTASLTDASLGERIRYLKERNEYGTLADFLIGVLAAGGLSPKLQGKAYNELGLAHLQLEAVDEAEKAFISATEFDANNMNAPFNRANLALYAQQYPHALAQYLLIVEKKADHAGAHHHAGLCHAMMGQPDMALPFFEKSAALDSDAMGPHYWAGETLLHASEYEKAFPYFRHAFELMPKHPESRRGLAICLYKQEKYSESIAHCDTLIEEGPDCLALRLKGDALLALKETTQGALCHIAMASLDFDAHDYLITRVGELAKHDPEQAQQYADIVQSHFPERGSPLGAENLITACRSN